MFSESSSEKAEEPAVKKEQAFRRASVGSMAGLDLSGADSGPAKEETEQKKQKPKHDSNEIALSPREFKKVERVRRGSVGSAFSLEDPEEAMFAAAKAAAEKAERAKAESAMRVKQVAGRSNL